MKLSHGRKSIETLRSLRKRQLELCPLKGATRQELEDSFGDFVHGIGGQTVTLEHVMRTSDELLEELEWFSDRITRFGGVTIDSGECKTQMRKVKALIAKARGES